MSRKVGDSVVVFWYSLASFLICKGNLKDAVFTLMDSNFKSPLPIFGVEESFWIFAIKAPSLKSLDIVGPKSKRECPHLVSPATVDYLGKDFSIVLI